MQPSRQPTGQPSMQPSSQPTGQPSRQPTRQPTGQPSRQPTGQPSRQPTRQPTGQPSRQPTGQPSRQPTTQPSAIPTGQPSTQPSTQPSSEPSSQPSKQPSYQPSSQPTSQPTGQPSSQPSREPSSQPSAAPTMQPTGKPSNMPSTQPSSQPTIGPSMQPSRIPSGQPSRRPSLSPTAQPSSSPSIIPSTLPTSQPSNFPTVSPTVEATPPPSNSQRPTSAPTSLYGLFDQEIDTFDAQCSFPGESLKYFHSNVKIEDYKAQNNDFRDFLNFNLNPPFKVTYEKLFAKNKVVSFGEETSPESSADCQDPDLVQRFVLDIKNKIDSQMICNGHDWRYSASSTIICVDCGNVVDTCPQENVHVFGSSIVCSKYAGKKVDGLVKLTKSMMCLGIVQKYVVINTVPKIKNVRLRSGKTNLTVDISFSGRAPGGTMYCAAVPSKDGKTPDIQMTSADSIKILATSLPYSMSKQADGSSVQKNSTIVIPKLVADTSYFVYCYGEDAEGNKGTTKEILSMQRVTSTLCCREIIFTNAPSSVKGDLLNYVDADPKAYVFTYELSAAPKKALTVVPVVYLDEPSKNKDTVVRGANDFSVGGHSDPVSVSRRIALTITANPASINFDSSTPSTQLSGTFVLQGGPPGKYFLELVPVGDQFDPAISKLTIQALFGPPPAPILKKVQFENSGAGAIATFDSKTDQPYSSSSSWSCSLVFSFIAANDTVRIALISIYFLKSQI